MNRRRFLVSSFACAATFYAAADTSAQKKTLSPDLYALAEGAGLKVYNRSVSSLADGNRRGARLSEGKLAGVAYLEGVEFVDGEIAFDVRGRDVLQRSFVGVAFHGIDEGTYEAVYFRPFNFRAEDPVRHSHAVQYISHPTHTWMKLRAEQPGRYEQPLASPPDPNAWFRARVAVSGTRVSVFVNGATAPSLAVERLTDRRSGRVGLWVGDDSGGDFANLKIVRA
jgi:hypothetical protein